MQNNILPSNMFLVSRVASSDKMLCPANSIYVVCWDILGAILGRDSRYLKPWGRAIVYIVHCIMYILYSVQFIEERQKKRSSLLFGGQEFIQFIAAVVVLSRTILKNRINSSISFNSSYLFYSNTISYILL